MPPYCSLLLHPADSDGISPSLYIKLRINKPDCCMQLLLTVLRGVQLPDLVDPT